MPEIVYVTLRYMFLVLLYVFVFLVAVVIYRELKPAASAGRSEAGRSGRRRKVTLAVQGGTGRRGQAGWELGEAVIIGRSEDCGISLPDEFASNQHAKVYQVEGRFIVEDLGSTNGTYVNGRRITFPTELRGGDTIKIGRTVLEFRR